MFRVPKEFWLCEKCDKSTCKFQHFTWEEQEGDVADALIDIEKLENMFDTHVCHVSGPSNNFVLVHRTDREDEPIWHAMGYSVGDFIQA